MNIAKALLLHHLKDLEVIKETKMKKTKGNLHSVSIQLLLEKKVSLLFLLFYQRKMIYHKNSLSRHFITHLKKNDRKVRNNNSHNFLKGTTRSG